MVSELQGVADWQLQGVIAEGENATVYRASRAVAGDSEPERALKLCNASTSVSSSSTRPSNEAKFSLT